MWKAHPRTHCQGLYIYRKTSFANFLMYGENEQNHACTIDNALSRTEKNVHNF